MAGRSATDVRALMQPVWSFIERCNPREARHQRVCEVALILLNLLQDLQLHRGLSGAALSRQAEFRGELHAVEHKLQRSLYMLAERYGDNHPVFRELRWRILLGHWEALRGNWRALDFQTNLEAHGEVILELLGILRMLGAENARLLGHERARMIASWPKLIEHFGVLRALGLRLLSRPDPVKDPDLSTSMKTHLQSARCALDRVRQSAQDPAPLEASQRALRRIEELLAGQLQGADAEAYYDEMTALIDDWFRLIRRRVRP